MVAACEGGDSGGTSDSQDGGDQTVDPMEGEESESEEVEDVGEEEVGWEPTRAMTIIVPAGAGGGSDQMTRQAVSVMERLRPESNFVVENVGGGGGANGISEFLRRPADGYTFLQVHGDAMLLFVQEAVPADLEAFEMVGQMQAGPATIFRAADDDRFETYDEMIRYMQNSGEPLTAAMFIPEGFDDLTLRLIEEEEGVEFNRVPYVDAGERFAALLSGRADILLQRLGDLRQFIEAGEMTPVIVDLDRDQLPEELTDVTTFDEAGLDFPLKYFRGFWAHADTPPEALDYFTDLVREAAADPEWVETESDRYYFDGCVPPEEWRRDMEEAYEFFEQAYSS